MVHTRSSPSALRRLSAQLLLALPLAALSCGDTPFTPNYIPASPIFSNPTAITNSYLPLSSLNVDVLEGTEGGQAARIVRTRLPATRTFTFNGQQVATVIVLDSAFIDGQLVEVARDYFAQSDAGDVYYFGEDVDNYLNGQIVNHEGAWLYGVHTDRLGLFMPAVPAVGQRFRPEDVPGITQEDDEVIAVGVRVTVPAGTFQNCVIIRERLSDGAIEFKVFAPGVGVVQEQPEDGEVNLIAHT